MPCHGTAEVADGRREEDTRAVLIVRRAFDNVNSCCRWYAPSCHYDDDDVAHRRRAATHGTPAAASQVGQGLRSGRGKLMVNLFIFN